MVSPYITLTAQKIKFFIEDLLSQCDQIRRKLQIWSHLLKKSLMENFIFCAVLVMTHDTSKTKLILFFKYLLTVQLT